MVTPATLLHAAAGMLAIVQQTRGMLADERAEAEAPRERAAIAAVALGRVDLATAYRVPLFALTGAPRLLLWTAASKALRVRGQAWLRRSALRSWGEVWDAVEAAPLAGLPAAVALDLRGEALQELQACREVRANGRAVAELAGSIDVRARAVGELLVPVLAAIGEGAPLLETGERLRAALRAWEG